jgi:hypothetical protein
VDSADLKNKRICPDGSKKMQEGNDTYISKGNISGKGGTPKASFGDKRGIVS